MNELQLFSHPDFGETRTITIDGEPWFVLRDVCDSLKISRTQDIAARLDDDEVGQTSVVDSRGQNQKTYIINEAGLYNVIMRSDKPEAKRFKRWVVHEVLPAIRKHGNYSLPQLSTNEMLLHMAQANVEMEKRQALLEERMESTEQLLLETGSKIESTLKTFAAPLGDTWTAKMREQINTLCIAKNQISGIISGRLYAELEGVASISLSNRMKRHKERMRKQGTTYKEREAVTKLDMIARDKQLRVVFEAIVKRHLALNAPGFRIESEV